MGFFMKKVTVNKLEPGMVTAEQILTKNGQMIVDKGVTLTRPLIMRLSFYCVLEVCIEDPDEPKDPETPHFIPAYSQKVKASKEFQTFQFDHSFVLNSLKSSMEGYVFHNQPLDTDDLLEQTVKLFNSCKTSLELFDMLHNMRAYDDSTYAHSLNVALICRRIGKWLKVDAATLDTLTLCGLLHDIGKLKIPDEILNKPDKYTDEEFDLVKRHTKFGYELLKTLNIDPHIKKAALLHHERCDGSGYPLKATQKDLDDFSMVVAIADVYDAMTAARSYRAPLCPFQVIERFEQEGFQKYKPKFILTFLQHIASTYQNNRVLLSNGQSANIVMLNQQHLARPIVQLNDNSCIDLSTRLDLHIQSIL